MRGIVKHVNIVGKDIERLNRYLKVDFSAWPMYSVGNCYQSLGDVEALVLEVLIAKMQIAYTKSRAYDRSRSSSGLTSQLAYVALNSFSSFLYPISCCQLHAAK